MVVPAAAGPRKAVIHERVTRGGRKLFYHLEVIQQPERARACGSGPKSSADRRPVDPPPVVELRIFEGASIDQAKDITFLYNANFFLFATLEHSRQIAHGRVQAPSANTPPILTGMPVSGMAYLDRPQEAGYFLFPDLSVRHEGRYRLSFNLYEETKEDKDKDIERSLDGKSPMTDSMNPEQASFDWRMEVKSDDFNVYSAKKFPGLTESTALSRTVAEQGCRVRIRRDVRMRRRDGKPADNYDNAEEEYNRRNRRTQTPDEIRARSLSNSSVDRKPYMPEPQRRPSGVDFAPPPPGFSNADPSVNRHLTFGSQPNAQYQPQQPTSVPPSPSYGPQGTPYAHPAPYPPVQSPSYPYSERPPSQHYSAPNPSPQRETYPVDYRRHSTSNYPPPPPSVASENEYKMAPSQQAPPPPQAPVQRLSLPSLQSLTASIDANSGITLPSPTERTRTPSLTLPLPPQNLGPQLPPLHPGEIRHSMKRSIDQAFPGRDDGMRYLDHRRQDDYSCGAYFDNAFQYRRANGEVIHLPPVL